MISDFKISRGRVDEPCRGFCDIAADFCEKKLAIYADIYYNIYPLRGVAQLVARLLWEQDAVGSSPATPTKKPMPTARSVSVFSIGRDSNPERAKSVKKAAGGSFFSFLVRRRVPKCKAFGSSSSGDAQSAAPSRHSDQKTDADRQVCIGFFNWKGLEP